MRNFLNVVRQACSSQTWSRGVQLARADLVSGDSENGGEVQLRVATRGGMISPSVTLYVDDGDWECSCNSTEDPCEHVAGAAIALHRARQEGHSLPAPTAAAGRIHYRLTRADGGLALEREVVHSEGAALIETTLDAIASGRVAGPRFAADERDLRIEVLLGSKSRGLISRDRMAKLTEALAGSDRVTLDGGGVQVSAERLLPRARLADAPGGFRLSVGPDPGITESFVGGAALCGNTLRAVSEPRLTGRELQDLPAGRFYSHEQITELVTEVLPSLSQRLPVDVETEKLPRSTATAKPELRIAVERRGDRMNVLPSLVYGSPPVARVDAGKLVHLSGEIPVRDLEAERVELRRLQRELGLSAGHRIEFEGPEAIQFAQRLASWRGELEGDAHRGFYRTAALEPSLRMEERGFDLTFEVPGTHDQRDEPRGGGSSPPRVSSDVVIGAWRAGDSLVALSGGGFAPLPEDWLGRFGHQIADLLDARAENGALPTSALPALAELCDDLGEERPAVVAQLGPLIENFEGVPRADLPDDLRAELRPYQREGVDWLSFLRDWQLGALLADDMGLGKTLQALCAVRGRTLVVTPRSVLHSWEDELKQFRPETRFAIYHGAKRQLDESAEITLTTYALLRQDAVALSRVEWECVVLDEAQHIKNPESQVARAAFRLSARFRLALTGTPIENRLEELWAQFNFLNRGLLGDRAQFRERASRPIEAGDREAADRLRSRLRPFVLRRLKREVAPELPARSEVVIHVPLDDEERRVYDAVRAAAIKGVVEKLRGGGNVMAALEALLRLRQAACHADLVPGQSADRSSKVDTLVERLAQAAEEGHRSLVFSQWTELLDRIEPPLGAAGLAHTRLDGSTRDRRRVVAEFQNEQGPPVMLVSLKAGGSGLTLTAADHVFLTDPWWNPAVEDQAADRAHRIGQTRPVVVHRLVALDTVEERILELHRAKRALSHLALEDASQPGGLSRDDLIGLLAD